jgi:hypothetical protein
MLVEVLTDELCLRADPLTLTEEVIGRLRAAVQEAVREATELPEDFEEQVDLLLPGLIQKTGVDGRPGALYPTALYEGLTSP